MCYFIHFIFCKDENVLPSPTVIQNQAKLKTTSCHKATSAVHGITQTHFRVDLLEGRIILIHLEVDFCRGDGKSPLGHHHRSNELGRSAENNWA